MTKATKERIAADDPRVWRGARRVYFTRASDFRKEVKGLFNKMVEKERKRAESASNPNVAFYAYARRDLLQELWDEFDALAKKGEELVDHMSWAVMQNIDIKISQSLDHTLDTKHEELETVLTQRCISENASLIREHWKGWGNEGDYGSFRKYFDGFEINPEYITQYEMKPLLKHHYLEVPKTGTVIWATIKGSSEDGK